MSYKENTIMGSPQSIIKPEPQEPKIVPLTPSAIRQNIAGAIHSTKISSATVKPEPTDVARVFLERGLPVPPYVNNVALSSTSKTADVPVAKSEDIDMVDASKLLAAAGETKPMPYTVYNTSTDISYAPEDALKTGLGMVKVIKESVKKLELGSKLRKDVWLREIESLQSQGAPNTLIAVCGATGAGKSSVMNAILDDNIVPTSGMRACTAVVTEIAHHTKKTIDADVSFLSEAEWRQELGVLLDDLVDEDGNPKRSTDLASDAGIAWSKVHAVYPTISQEQLINMTVDQIVAKDPKIAKILGTTKNIVAANSKIFTQEIGKYIDSKDQKRGKKDKKHKDKDSSKRNVDTNAPALWPLIRQVNVRCSAAALSTGARLVDLPGTGDSNAARNNIAKTYMKQCDCIWILAPITRAVDDKTARDLLGDAFKMQLMNGNYDAHAITFIASKCDDISCSEVIRALHLDDDPELEEIETRIEQYANETKRYKKKKAEIEGLIKEIDTQLKEARACFREHDAHKSALERGEPFESITGTEGKKSKADSEKVDGKKRKNGRGGKKGSPKRRRSDELQDDVDDLMASEDESDIESSSEDSESGQESGSEDDSDSDDSIKPSSRSDSDSDDDNGDEEEEETVETLKVKIDEAKNVIKNARERLSEARKEKKHAMDSLASLKKNQVKAQREKNAFCSLKRSEFSREVLKEDFRVGLKDLDDAAAEERDPENFDPTINIRNYDEIDLPVFTCSARDYVRLTRQVKGDGDPSCFSHVKDTGIPELQSWCHQLTVSSRERAARNFLSHIKTFATSVQTYVQGIGDVTVSDREELRKKWESSATGVQNGLDTDDEDDDNPYSANYDDSDPLAPFVSGLAPLGGGLGGSLYSLNQRSAPKVDAYGEPIGVTPRLTKDFGKVTNRCVEDLKESFRDGLEDKCRIGAINAADAAVAASDEFAASMHWGTYRATLRRHGSWRRDLNVELLTPFTRNIAASWGKVFETDLFAAFGRGAVSSINKLLEEIEDSAAPGLKDRTKIQGEVCLEEAKVAMHTILDVVKESLNSEQKEISRCLAPHVQDQLMEGYDRAMEERGTGSVARQKLLFHNYVNDCKDDVFEGGAEVLMERLSKAAEAIGHALDSALVELAEKIEVSLAVLWEGSHDDPSQVRARKEVVDSVTDILAQVQLWKQAEQLRTTTTV